MLRSYSFAICACSICFYFSNSNWCLFCLFSLMVASCKSFVQCSNSLGHGHLFWSFSLFFLHVLFCFINLKCRYLSLLLVCFHSFSFLFNSLGLCLCCKSFCCSHRFATSSLVWLSFSFLFGSFFLCLCFQFGFSFSLGFSCSFRFCFFLGCFLISFCF